MGEADDKLPEFSLEEIVGTIRLWQGILDVREPGECLMLDALDRTVEEAREQLLRNLGF